MCLQLDLHTEGRRCKSLSAEAAAPHALLIYTTIAEESNCIQTEVQQLMQRGFFIAFLYVGCMYCFHHCGSQFNVDFRFVLPAWSKLFAELCPASADVPATKPFFSLCRLHERILYAKLTWINSIFKHLQTRHSKQNIDLLLYPSLIRLFVSCETI